jgi:hypothetical protein
MHEQIQSFLDVIGKRIEDTAIKYFDRYAEQMAEHVEAFRASGGEVPDQPMLRPEFRDYVKALIGGAVIGVQGGLSNDENAQAVKIASNQIGFAVQDYLKSVE